MGLYNPYWTRKAQGLCIPIGIGEPIELIFKQGGGKKKKKKKPNPKELYKVFFLKP